MYKPYSRISATFQFFRKKKNNNCIGQDSFTYKLYQTVKEHVFLNMCKSLQKIFYFYKKGVISQIISWGQYNLDTKTKWKFCCYMYFTTIKFF